MAQEKYVHSNKVMFEKEAEDGIRYLNDKLDGDCANVFFSYAKSHGSAPFEDQQGHRYDLSYENGVYMLIKR